MPESGTCSIAVVGVGAVLPDAPNASTFWENLKAGRYSITETPVERWDPALYYDPDPLAPDKTYSKIGGWVRDFDWSPLEWRLPVPPKVSDAMDRGQKWSVGACREALLDYGYPNRPLDAERTAVVLGNAMGGDLHYQTALPIYLAEYVDELAHLPSFAALSSTVRDAVVHELSEAIHRRFPGVSEDSMPGELGNIIAGRVANLFNFRGPNFIVDAACASALAAIGAAIGGLQDGEYDAVLTGGVDANMSASTYVKFCKIGALSATGTRPYYEGSDGFVMGEGGAVFLLKRLADAERAGDHVYAVLRGIGGASDGKGKGITAPNPVGQQLAIARAWTNAGRAPDSASYIEGHGTSTKVGDVVEVESLSHVFADFGLKPGSIPLGSVKSNLGHLKSAAGAAGMLKAVCALDHKLIPPSLGGSEPNHNIDFRHSPLFINDELREWKTEPGQVRSVGVSAFGFGGTNFHVVLEEYVPGRITMPGAAKAVSFATTKAETATKAPAGKLPLRGAVVIGGHDEAEVLTRARALGAEAVAGRVPPRSVPAEADLRARVRLAIDYGDAAELAIKVDRAIKALEAGQPAMWRALRNQGVFLGRAAPAPVAFLYTGQGSQYLNMLRTLRETEPIVADTFAEADRLMTPILGRPLTDYLFVDSADPSATAAAEEQLRQTEITQPAVLTVDHAITRLLGAYAIQPDMVIGHSLGEYGALVAVGAMSFAGALEAVSARGREMAHVAVADNGLMAAVFAPLEEIEEVLAHVDGYVVIANINSTKQAVIGGASAAVREAVERLMAAGHQAMVLPVSHAFHTEIVAPAAEPLMSMLRRLRLESPALPLVANVDGNFYPMGPNVLDQMIDILGRQIASPVQFVKGLRTLYDAGCRVFVEVGPKRALHGFVEEVLGDDPEVLALFTNHPKQGDIVAFNQALCGLYSAGLGFGSTPNDDRRQPVTDLATAEVASPPVGGETPSVVKMASSDVRQYEALGRLFAEFLAKGNEILGRVPVEVPVDEPVVVTGAGLGLPGGERVFGDDKVPAILRGEQFIESIPVKQRQKIVDKHITRLVKTTEGGGRFESIESVADVIKLAGRAGVVDLVDEFGFPAEREESLDVTSKLAIGAGLDALRDAGIPLVMHYKTATTGRKLPERWMLPEDYRDTTGVIFASAFPGLDALVGELESYHDDRARQQRLDDLQDVRAHVSRLGEGQPILEELDHRMHALQVELQEHPYEFDRKFLFHALSMGHSQFAEYIGARGPNTQVNSACASTTQAVALAQDWIRAGRCERVVIVSGDDVTSDRLLEWFGSGFLASGAAATDDVVADAAVPFDRRRHGMILGMGAAAIVVETAASAARRGIRPIVRVLSAKTANSAFHGSRLDPVHICEVMEDLVATAERCWGIDRREIAPQTVFISHETYTPARGGSAQAEVDALRYVFGESAGQVVISNTKGFTGHAMGVGVEDVVAVKALETGIVPPVPNYKVPDPELGELNLSQGGTYPIRYALRLGAGFGSQISMTLYEVVLPPGGHHPEPDQLGFEYRIVDDDAWRSWLVASCGLDSATTEIAKRTLRIRDDGPPAEMPAAASATAAMVEAPVVEAVPAVVESVPAAAPVEGDGVEQRVLAIVAEQTGYPVDMLEPDLDLEADLGIDTVKQAETFAAIRAAYDIERDDSLALRDYPTLRHVIAFVYERAPGFATAVTAAATAATAAVVEAVPAVVESVPVAAPVEGDGVEQRVLAIVAEQTGYPVDMLEPDLDLEADLGIDTVKQAETFAAIRAAYDIERDDSLALRDYPTLRHVIAFVYERAPGFATAVTAAATAATAAVVEAVPAVVESVPVAAPVEGDGVEQRVLAIVAEQTGYPVDMLEPDLDLEADLGIDTVKQAETFAAIRAAYDIERDDSLALRDYPTLRHVIAFVYERAPGFATAVTAAATAASQPPAPSTVVGELLEGDDDAAEAIVRRVPTAVLRPPLELCRPTAVTLGQGSRVVVVSDDGGVGAALTDRLQTMGVEVLAIDGAPAAADLESHLDAFASAGPIQGVYWLPALDVDTPLLELDLAGWREALRRRVKLLFAAMRHIGGAVEGEATFLVSATRLGGRHGYEAAGAAAPMGGAVTGFTKAFHREHAGVLVKAVDFSTNANPAAVAALLVDETLSDPGAVEVGHHEGRRWTIALEDVRLDSEVAGVELTSDTVFAITGAAGSIVTAITADLARASKGTFHLLDLVPEPDPADPDIAAFTADKEALKRTIFDRMKAAGERATPAVVEKEMARIERAHAALSAIGAIRSVGGEAHYHSVDLRDGEAVSTAVERIFATSGRIDVLLHAGGLEVSRRIEDKTPAEYDLVFDVKADGWFNLLRAIGDRPLRAAVVFSSVAGRFGNAGQTDYSAANDLLCKEIAWLNGTRPNTLGIAIDWTAWADIGMASRGSIPTVMKAAGIDMLPARAGIPIVRRELTLRKRGGEVVIGQRLGVLVEENDSAGGLDTGGTALTRAAVDRSALFSDVVGWPVGRGLTLVASLDPAEQPFLHDHQIDGTPVLPGVMGVEAFAEAALLLEPEMRLAAIEDVAFLAPFKFYRHEPRQLTVTCQFTTDGDDLLARCALLGRRQLPNRDEPEETVHFTGTVRLSKTPTALDSVTLPAMVEPTVTAEDIYRIYFHGPAYQVLDEAWKSDDVMVGRLAAKLPPSHHPEDISMVTVPRLLELAFQTVGVMEIGTRGVLGLPMEIGRVRFAGNGTDGTEPIAAVVRMDDDMWVASVVDAGGRCLVDLSGYRTIALPRPLEDELVLPLRRAVGSAS